VRVYNGTSVYRFYDQAGVLLYVGVANRPAERWADHSGKPWWHLVARTELERYPTRAEALRVEAESIRYEHPRYNQLVPNLDGSVRGAHLRADSLALAKRRGPRTVRQKPLPQHQVRISRSLWDAYGVVARFKLHKPRSDALIAHIRRTIQRHGTDEEKQLLAEADAEIAERLARKHAGRPPKRAGE
jgi:hypothetical protein